MPRHLLLAALLALACTSFGCSTTAPDDGDDGEGRRDDEPPALLDCEDNTDCKGGEVCREGKCRTACDADNPCAGFYGACDEALGYCVQCVSDEHCDEDEACSAGLCEPFCREDGHCGSGQACDEETGDCFEIECEGNADCQGGYACRDGRCESLDPVVCEPDSTRCDGDVVVTCNGDGTRETRTACAEDETCVEDGDLAACLALVCQPNEIGCVDDGTAFVCDATGTGRTDLPCRADQYCQAGVCQNQQCAPGSVTCDGDAVVVCDERGASAERVPCNATPDCQDEPFGCTCAAGACTARLCQPESTSCVGNGYRRCNDDGTAFEAPVACDDICVAGACVSSTCTPGDTMCSGEALLTCNALGSSWTLLDCAADGETCVESGSSASCGARVCEPLSTSCSADGRLRLSCDAFGTTLTETPCGSGRFCEDGACRDQVCEPNARSCAGPASVQVCDAQGGSLDVTACASGEICEDGACVEQGCTPDCSGRVCGPDPVCGTSCGTCASGSCDASGQCTVPAGSGLEVVLSWNNANADLDVHLANDAADAVCSADTCYWGNCRSTSTNRPDWDGSGGVSDGDPELQVAEIDGPGPETVVLRQPRVGTYVVRAHVFTLNEGQTVTATVLVKANGTTVGSYTQQLTADNDLWDGVRIQWGTPTTASDTNGVVPDVSCDNGGGGGDTLLCSTSSDCPEGQFCSSQPILGGTCAVGCADDGDCPGQICNGAGDCVASSTDLGTWNESCEVDSDCEYGFVCGYFSRRCEERCPADGAGSQYACGADPDCCPRSNAQFCTADPFFGAVASCTN